VTYDDWKLATPPEYESPAPRSDDLGDDVEPCGCEESEVLRAELERVKGLARVTAEVLDGELAKSAERRDRLTEATALLARAHQFGVPHPAIRRDIGTFLSRAPAQSAALEPVGPQSTGKWNRKLYDEPAAPEPSAEPPTAGCHDAIDYIPGETDRQSAVRWMRQCLAAEAQLAAVEDFECLKLDRKGFACPCCQAVYERYMSAAFPAPSPGAGQEGSNG